MHTVAVLALPGVIVFDLGTPLELFGRCQGPAGEPLYDVTVVGPERRVRSGPVELVVDRDVEHLSRADTVIVPGRHDPLEPVDTRTAAALRSAATRGARLASICVGAFDLAAAGLLDGLRATTHWRAAAELASAYPTVEVDPAALFIDNGTILTSAGAAAGIDLCLHLIGRDHGGTVAAQAARTAVVPLTRDADQAQYIRDDELGDCGLSATLQWIDDHAREPLSAADIARHAAVSTRTLNRRFATQLGVTPSSWLNRARVRRAQRLLETTDWSVERIARESGLGSSSNLRTRFHDVVGTSPTRYRHALRPT